MPWPGLTGMLVLAVLWVGPAAQAEPADALRGEGRVVSIDGAEGSITVDHEPIAGLVGRGRTEFPAGDVELLRRVRVGDRIAFTLAPQAGSHGVLSIASIETASPGWAQQVWRSGALTVGILGVLLAGLIAMVWRHGARARAPASGRLEPLLGALRSSQVGQQELTAGLAAAARALEALGRQAGDTMRAMTARLEAARAGGSDRPARHGGRVASLVVVRHGETDAYDSFERRLGKRGLATVIWDRRSGDRRRRDLRVAANRRQGERREPPSMTWDALGYVLTESLRRPLRARTGEHE